MELRDMLANPVSPLRDVGGFLSLRDFFGEDARADQGPEGLIIVLGGWFHDSDVIALKLAAQLGGHGDAGGAAAKDQDLVVILERGVRHGLVPFNFEGIS